MAKFKINDNVLGIVWQGASIYFKNFSKFMHYMAFPVLGQLFGLILVFGFTHLYNTYLPGLIETNPMFNNFTTIIFCSLLVGLPGLFIFTKAFWDYLVSYGALNSMAEAAMTTGKIYDFPAYNAVVTRRTFKYIMLWLAFSIFTLISSIPLLWIIGLILFAYFVLIFQVFTFEDDKSVYGCFKRSLQLIKGNLAKTFGLLAVLFLLTYWLLQTGIVSLMDAMQLSGLFASFIEGWTKNLPLEQINAILTSVSVPPITPIQIAKSIVENAVFFIIVGFTLPLRSIVWTLWYKKLTPVEAKPVKTNSKKTLKVSDKTTLKNSKTPKKIDPEIIRRAWLKDYEE